MAPTRWTRTMCAPKRTLAATAAAVPHSRSCGALSQGLLSGRIFVTVRRGSDDRGHAAHRAARSRRTSARPVWRSHAWIDDDRRARDAGRHSEIDRLAELVRDLARRILVHVARRRAAVVHQHDGRARVPHGRSAAAETWTYPVHSPDYTPSVKSTALRPCGASKYLAASRIIEAIRSLSGTSPTRHVPGDRSCRSSQHKELRTR